MSNFGPDSNNPRLRRAFAHTQLSNFRKGKTSFEDARRAVDAASHTRKGQSSPFEVTLIKIAIGAIENPVLFIEWTGGLTERPAFGGSAMTLEEALVWEQKAHESLAQQKAYWDADESEMETHAHAHERDAIDAFNMIYYAGYPSLTLTTSADQKANFTMCEPYSLSANPAKARLEKINN